MKYLFMIPGAPAPIGGFKLLYEHGRILQDAGHDVCFLHLNGGLLKEADPKGMFLTVMRRLKFSLLNLFGNWRHYPEQEFGLRSAWKQKVSCSDINEANVLVIASWQLLNEMYDSFDLSDATVVHPVMDYPGFMGPEEKIHRSWEQPAIFFCISNYLYSAVLAHAEPKCLVNIGCMLTGRTTRNVNFGHEPTPRPRRGILLSFATGIYKNPEGTCALVRALNDKFHEEPITVFGRPPRPSSLPADVTYLQNIDDAAVARLYSSSKIFVFFSDFEGFGLMPLEAMSHSCPVVSTDCFGNRDYIEHRSNALVIKPGDVSEAVSCVASLLNDEGLRNQLVNGGLDTAREFAPHKFKSKIIEAYENL